jgi:hypothetical protein
MVIEVIMIVRTQGIVPGLRGGQTGGVRSVGHE